VGLLAAAGARTLTTAADGASQRMRDQVDRHTRVEDLLRAAQLCRAHGMSLLKLYVLIGLPGESQADMDELAGLALELTAIAPKLSLTLSPFVPKRNTPLDGLPQEDIASLEDKIAGLRRHLRGRATLGGDSPKWSWVEYRLAQGGFREGLAAAQAARTGGSFAAWARRLRGASRPRRQVDGTAISGPRSERAGSGIHGGRAQLLFNAQQLVVLGHAFGPSQ
jgi:radical SAM superfamily enzyme YgiQ (UPF0313 family)